jgi:hypothetical protein
MLTTRPPKPLGTSCYMFFFYSSFSLNFLCALLKSPAAASYSSHLILLCGYSNIQEQNIFRSSIVFSRAHPTFVSVSPKSSAKSRSLFVSWAQWTPLLCTVLLSTHTYLNTYSHISSITGNGLLQFEFEDAPCRHEKRPTKFKKQTQQTIKRKDMTADGTKWTNTPLIRAHLIKN